MNKILVEPAWRQTGIHNFELCNIYNVGGNRRENFYNYATSTFAMGEEGWI